MRRKNWRARLVGAAALAFAAGAAVRRGRRKDLHGQVALIFGGSRSLGLAIAQELAAAGCRLVIAGRDDGALAEAWRDLEARGAEVLARTCDVGDPAAIDAVVAAARARFGAIDILVNVAGLIRSAPRNR